MNGSIDLFPNLLITKSLSDGSKIANTWFKNENRHICRQYNDVLSSCNHEGHYHSLTSVYILKQTINAVNNKLLLCKREMA